MPIVRLFLSVLAAMYAFNQGYWCISHLGDEAISALSLALSGVLTLASLAISVWLSFSLFVPEKKDLGDE